MYYSYFHGLATFHGFDLALNYDRMNIFASCPNFPTYFSKSSHGNLPSTVEFGNKEKLCLHTNTQPLPRLFLYNTFFFSAASVTGSNFDPQFRVLP